ncbi:hypothetical protein, unknown function [Leishmania tarentolae]|uniref:Uncharacterized protein n=1 Tax=Leishmania tarentolae TaxID=5689 RepID=A0A640KT82_LEITA|nr:hypothetical protein, unknown function [Leishmania tarentolae]
MAYAYTGPTSINYILQRAYDELRRGENQHYRSTEVQYMNHVKELLGNLERYLETCGVRLPAEVQEGAEITAAAAAAGKESDRAAFSAPLHSRMVGTERVDQGRRISSGSASASVMIGISNCDDDVVNRHEEASNNVSVYSSGPLRSGWEELETPCEAQRGSGAANVCPVASSCPVAAATSTFQGISLKSSQEHTMSDSSPCRLGAPCQQLSAQDSRSVRTANNEDDVGILYQSQHTTTPHAAHSSSSPPIATDVGAGGNKKGNITSLMYSGDATGVDSCSVDSGSAPIVAIIDSGCGGSNGTRSREHGESLAMKSPPTPPNLPEHYTREDACNGLYASGDGFSRSASTHPTVSNAFASTSCVSDAGMGATRTAVPHNPWGEVGTLVQPVTESRQNSNVASFMSEAALGCPLPDGANGAVVVSPATTMRNVEKGSSGAVSAPLAVEAPPPRVDPKLSFPLAFLPSIGPSTTTSPAPVLSAATRRQVQLSPLNSSSVEAEAGGNKAMTDVKLDKPLSHSFGILSSPLPISPVPRQHGVKEAGRVVPRVEYIPSPPQHSGLGPSASFTAVVAPLQSAASEPLVNHRLSAGGGDGTDSIAYRQQAQRGSAPPHPRTSASMAAASVAVATTALAKNPEKEKLMHRLREVLARSVSGKSSVTALAVPSAVSLGRQSPFPDDAAWSVGRVQEKHSAADSTRVPVSAHAPGSQRPLQHQQTSGSPTPFPNTTTTDDTIDGSANVQHSERSSDLKNGGKRGDGPGGVAFDDSWGFIRLSRAAASACPYTTSSKDIVSEAATSHSVSRGTVHPKDTCSDEDGGSMEPPRFDHTLKETCCAHRCLGSSNRAAIMSTARASGGLSASHRWDTGSCTTVSNNSSRTYTKEMIAASFVANEQHSPSSLLVPTSSARSARSPPALTKNDIEGCSRDEEVLGAHQMHSAGGKRALTNGQQPSERDDGERQSFPTNFSSAHAEKQQLMQRLRMVLSRNGECVLNNR